MLDLGQRLILLQCLCERCTVKLFVGQLTAILLGKGFGLTSRFSKIYEEYKKAPEVTRKRMYLETMERVLGGTDKIILDSNNQSGAGSGVVPYLPLNELRRAPAPAQTPSGGAR